MRSVISTVLVIVAVSSLLLSSGFQGIRWGTGIEAVKLIVDKKIVYQEDFEDNRIYSFGVIDKFLDQTCMIIYSFLDDHFYMATVNTEFQRGSNSDFLLPAFNYLYDFAFLSYGPPTYDKREILSVDEISLSQKLNGIFEGSYSPTVLWKNIEGEIDENLKLSSSMILRAIKENDTENFAFVCLTFYNTYMHEKALKMLKNSTMEKDKDRF